MNEVEIELLADHQDAIPIVASWLHSEWGHLVANSSVSDLAERLKGKANRTKIPVHLIAMQNDVVVGFVALKLHEMKRFPEKEHWLGSLYVPVEHRGKGIGKQLIQKVITVAQNFAVKTLYLQTEQLDGSLYLQMGWIPLETVSDKNDKVLIMAKNLNSSAIDCKRLK